MRSRWLARGATALRNGVLGQGGVLLAGHLVLALGKAAVLWSLARWEGPASQGAFSLAMAGMAFGAVVLGGGLEYANSFMAGRHPDRVPALLRNTMLLFALAVIAAPVWALGFTRALPAVAAPTAGGWQVVGLLGAGTALMSLQAAMQALAVGQQRFVAVARASVCAAVLVGGGGVLGAWLGYGFEAALAAWLAGSVVFVAVVPGRAWWRGLGGRPDGPLLRGQLSYGVRTLPGSVARALNMRAGLYAVSLFLPPAQLGVYGVVLAVAELFLYLPTSLGVVVLGRASAGAHSSRDQRVAYVAVGALGAAAAASAAVAGRPFLALVFGPAYTAGAGALAILLLAATVHAVGLLRLHELLGKGDPLAATWAQLSVLGMSVAGAWLLVPRLGIEGAALSMLVVYSAFTALLLARSPEGRSRPGPGHGSPGGSADARGGSEATAVVAPLAER